MPSFRETAKALARNLRVLMEHHKLSQAQLSKATGVGQSTLSVILNVDEVQASNPTIETVERIASHFRIQSWILIQPAVTLEQLLSPGYARLIAAYSALPPEGRQTVERVAEAERLAAGAQSVAATGT